MEQYLLLKVFFSKLVLNKQNQSLEAGCDKEIYQYV